VTQGYTTVGEDDSPERMKTQSEKSSVIATGDETVTDDKKGAE